MSNSIILVIIIFILLALSCLCCVRTYDDKNKKANYNQNQNVIQNQNSNSEIGSNKQNVQTPTPTPIQTPQIPELEIVESSWKKQTPKVQEDESLVLIIWTVTIKNNTNKTLGNIYYEVDYFTETGKEVYEHNTDAYFYPYITKSVPPKSKRTFTFKSGYINEVAEKAKISILRWEEIK